jgi:hypothetical protein
VGWSKNRDLRGKGMPCYMFLEHAMCGMKNLVLFDPVKNL